jgi:hypothetical protein
MAKTVDEIANAMYQMVADAAKVKKKLKPMDLTKAMVQSFGDEVDKKLCKAAIKQLIDSGKCVYTYFGGSYIEIPHREAAAND